MVRDFENANKAYNRIASHKEELANIFERILSWSSTFLMNPHEMIPGLASQQKIIETVEMMANPPEAKIVEKMQKEIDCIDNDIY